MPENLRLVSALMGAGTVREAAEKACVSESTVYRRLRQPAFRKRLREARLLAFGQALSRLQGATGDAVDTLVTVMSDKGSPAASRVRAACAVLELASRGLASRGLGPEVLQESLDADARREALARGDVGAYLKAGGSRPDWQLDRLIDGLHDFGGGSRAVGSGVS